MPTRRLGIDLGTANVRLFTRRQGVLLDEPSAIAWVPGRAPGERGEVLSTGHRALESSATLVAHAEVVRPIAAPAVTDLAAASALLHRLVDDALAHRSLFRPEVVLAVPPAASTRERRTLSEAVLAAGARRSWLVDQGLAAALGGGLQPAAGECAVLDIGAGTAQFALLDPTGTVVQETFPTAGDALDGALLTHFRDRLALEVEVRAAEQLKRAVGAALPLEQPLATEVTGASDGGGGPRRVRVTSDDVTAALTGTLATLAESIRGAVDDIPTSHLPALFEHGLLLVGGVARLRRLDEFLTDRVGVPVRVADDPQTCVVRGTVTALETLRVFRERQLYLG